MQSTDVERLVLDADAAADVQMGWQMGCWQMQKRLGERALDDDHLGDGR